MRKQLCAFWLIGSAVAFAPALAHAEDEPKPYPECTKTPTESETAAAKGAYQAGNASFDEADYPRALTYWEDAYRRDCTANLLLKNLARAYELYGQKRQAVVALETFLVREPNSSDKEQIQRRIEVLKKQIGTEKAASPNGPPAPTTAPQPPPPTPEPPPSTAHTGKRPIAPLIVAGSGGVVLIIGLAVYGAAAKDVKHYDDLCPTKNNVRDCGVGAEAVKNRDAGEAARKKAIAGGVIAGVGAAAVAGGLLWYVLSPRSGGSSASLSPGTLAKPRFDPALSPGFAGVSLSGAF